MTAIAILSSRSRSRMPQRQKDWFNNVKRQWEDDGRVLLNGDLRQCLEVAQLESAGLGTNHIRGLCQRRRSLQFTLCMYDLGPLLSLCLGLLRHGTLHRDRQLNFFDFDGGHLDAPTLSMLINDDF